MPVYSSFPLPLVISLWAAFATTVFCEISAAGKDDASRYAPGSAGTSRWMGNAHQGDVEFGVWEHEAFSSTGFAGRFIGSSTAGAGNIDTAGQSFGIYANPSSSTNPFATATRKFAKPALTTGDILGFKIAVNNRSPGNRGFNLVSGSNETLFNFDVRSGGYYVNGDAGGSLGTEHHSNTVFTFTFSQRERRVDYTIERSGGITSSTSGSFPSVSGSVAAVRFYITGTDPGAAGNLYFNQFKLETSPREDAPLTLGERRFTGVNPTYLLRFSDPTATAVALRHSGDSFASNHDLTKSPGGDWFIDIRTVSTGTPPVTLDPGWHAYKFVLDGTYESGDNRWLYLDNQGRIAYPPAVYLTWQRDPSRTMTVCWYNHKPAAAQIKFRPRGGTKWSLGQSSSQPFPHTARHIHTAEITGLNPDSEYEFQVEGYDEVFWFRTMPEKLTSNRPVKFGVGGDVDVGEIPDAMTATVSAQDPDFLVVGGDHAYDDARPDQFWKWCWYMESWFRNARSPENRMIPLVVGVGNHEVRLGYAVNHPDFDNSPQWRDRYATYYYRTFPFPGPQSPYGVLDFGDYLSLIMTDTEHSSPPITGSDSQTEWLRAVLAARRRVANVIPIHHIPAYPSHRSFDGTTSQRLRQHWVPLYESAGVQLVFENHDHTFKKTKPLLSGKESPSGIRYLGDGLWGIGKRSPDVSRPYLESASATHHIHLVTLDPSGRTVEALDRSGDFFGGKLRQPPAGIPSSSTRRSRK